MSGVMNVLDLFSGIGGFSLGLERAGMRTVAFCEREPYARAVLAKHWPDVPCYPDVCELTADRLARDGISVDVICGGFPCQDISLAGKGAGLAGERSGLWREYARLIGELRPRFVIVENVAALLSRGLAEVLGDMAAIGFDAEWHCIPAAAVGAPHRRDRIWIIAYPKRDELRQQPGRKRWPHGSDSLFAAEYGFPREVADATGERCREARQLRRDESSQRPGGSGEEMADTSSSGRIKECAHGGGISGGSSEKGADWLRPELGGWWLAEPDVGRVANGIPSRVDRLRCLGNAVVPQIPEIIGRAIMSNA
jgi:DNA (cytosine-5)-methyltransferase 1